MEGSKSPRRAPMIVLVGFVAALSGVLIGYNTAVIAPALDFLIKDFHLGPLAQGLVVSAVLFGGFIGSLCAGALIRHTGERPVLFVTAFLFVLGAAGSGFSESVAALVVLRMVAGLGVGAATMVAPLYVSETTPARMRGAFVSIIQLAITIGILVSYLTGALWTPSGSWQLM